MMKKLLAEGLGTFWLVFGGVGSVVLWGGSANVVNVALAFGLMAGLVIGLCLALIHMIGIGVTGVSVNPARSLGPAIFSGAVAMKHLWLFFVAPAVGAVAGAYIHRGLEGSKPGAAA